MSPKFMEQKNQKEIFTLKNSISKYLEARRLKLKMSQKEYAEKLGITPGRVSQILKNPGNMTLNKVGEYSKALGLCLEINFSEIEK